MDSPVPKLAQYAFLDKALRLRQYGRLQLQARHSFYVQIYGATLCRYRKFQKNRRQMFGIGLQTLSR